MKIKILYTVLVLPLIFLGIGCSQQSLPITKEPPLNTFSRNGVEFSYPTNLAVTYGEYYVNDQISVIQKPLAEYVSECNARYNQMPVGYRNESLWMIGTKQQERLLRLKSEGLKHENYLDLVKIDPIDCLTFEDNVFKIIPWTDGDTHGIIRYQFRGDDCCSISNFIASLITLNKFNELIVITFQYNFGGYVPPQEYDTSRDAHVQFKAFTTSQIRPSIEWLNHLPEAEKEIEKVLRSTKIE